MQHLQIPTVTMEDLVKFQKDHFPGTRLMCPIAPAENEVYNEEVYEDEDLGYYEDGVKRTLTDEQIRIFRHTEIHSLLRERERLREEAKEEAEEAARQAIGTDCSQADRDGCHQATDEPLAVKTESLDTLMNNNTEKRNRAAADDNAGLLGQNAPADEKSRAVKKSRPDNVSPDVYIGRKIVSYSDD